MGHRLSHIAPILAFLTIALAGAPGGAADLAFGVVTPGVSIVPLGATVPLTATGHFTDGSARRLSHATIAAGGNHACVLEPNGEIRCWGRGGSGQLGNGTSIDSSVPVTVAGIVDAAALAAGGDSSCVLLADTTLRCWGLNSSGQLGNGTTTASSLPVTVAGITALGVSAGFAHACAVLTSGEVACWGANAAGQLGNGTLVGSSSPVLVSGISTAVGVAAGGDHSCALLATGEVKCWGAGGLGQMGNGGLAGSPTPVDVSGIDDAVAIDAGFDHACALIAGGALQCWGRGSEGQLGNGQFLGLPTPMDVIIGSERAVALGVGNTHGCAVLENGALKCWGRNANGQLGNGTTTGTFPTPVSVVGISTAVAVDAGFEQTCALLADGNATCFGLNDAGQLGMGTTGGTVQRSGVPLTVSGPVLAVDAGGNHTCAVTPTGTANCWGYGFYGQLGNDDVSDSSVPTTVVRLDNSAGSAAENGIGLALGFDHSCAVLQSGGAKCWGRNHLVQLGTGAIDPPQLTTPDDVYQVSTAARIASGAFHSCIVLQTGAVQCWGANDFGALGNSDPAHSSFPKTVAGITTATRVSAGLNHTCALLSSGIVQCWGRGNEGQLGNGSFANSSSPVAVAGITTATSIGVGNSHSCARLVGGSVRCWGRNVEGQLGNSSTVGSAVPVNVTGLTSATGVTGGGFHSCVTLSSGGVNCWGRGDLGQLGNGFRFNISAPVVVTGLAGAVAVDAARSHTCAVLIGGRLRCWGYGEFGQLGHGASGAGLVADTPVVVNGINMDAAALTWSSADPSIATVDMSGRVHGVGVGTTTISWQYDSRTGFVPIEVPEPGMLVGVLTGGLGLSRLARRRQRSRTLGGPLSGRRRLILSCLLVAGASLFRAPLAGAIVANRVESGIVLQARGAGFPTEGLAESPPPLISAAPLDDVILRPIQSGPAQAGCTVLYGASPGHLHLTIAGDANSPPIGGIFAQAICSAAVETGELVTLDTPSLPQGSLVRVHALHFMIGTSVSTDVVADFPDQAGASASLSFPAHQYQTQGPNGLVSPPLTFNVTMSLQVGQAALLSMRLEGSGIAIASSGSSHFDVHAGNSLHWGGIDWIEDLATGQPITSWTIQSESGTDYSQPVGLPEPSGGVVLGAGVAALAAACRPRRCAA